MTFSHLSFSTKHEKKWIYVNNYFYWLNPTSKKLHNLSPGTSLFAQTLFCCTRTIKIFSKYFKFYFSFIQNLKQIWAFTLQQTKRICLIFDIFLEKSIFRKSTNLIGGQRHKYFIIDTERIIIFNIKSGNLYSNLELALWSIKLFLRGLRGILRTKILITMLQTRTTI